MSPADLVILGGGCAGLSLAARLARLPSSLEVHLIEPRTAYPNDRTWCFWAPHDHPWTGVVSHRWDAWRFATVDTSTVQRPTTPLGYHCIAADRFAHAMVDVIAEHPRIHLHLGTAAHDVDAGRDGLRVTTDAGDLVARHVVDTRPTPPAPNTFGQRFVGAEVEFDDDRFDPQVAGLMLEMEADDLGFRFTYLLPFTARRALIEETRFSRPVPEARLEEALAGTVHRIADGADHRTIRDERGFIPMTTKPAEPGSGGVVSAGLRAGAARPSTGYAFVRVQRWADACAASLADGGPPLTHPAEPSWRRRVDDLFLRVLDTEPDLAPTVFAAMAEGVRPETLVRFLSDDARYRDFAQVVRALPKLPFLRELVGGRQGSGP